MPTNWPPPTAPAWPPLEIGASWFSTATLSVLVATLQELGFTHEAPTPDENNEYFKQVKCDEGHPCAGRMLISPSGTRYPIAYCTGAAHKDILVLWPPYYMGYASADMELL